MKEKPLVLVSPVEADPHPPRCRHCRAIVETQFRGWPLPPGTGYCPTHNVVRVYTRENPRRPW